MKTKLTCAYSLMGPIMSFTLSWPVLLRNSRCPSSSGLMLAGTAEPRTDTGNADDAAAAAAEGS
jgi:hypothetical protein